MESTGNVFMYPTYPAGSVPPPYGLVPPSGPNSDQSNYRGPSPPGFIADPQAGYAAQPAYLPGPYPPQPSYPVSVGQPPPSSCPAGPGYPPCNFGGFPTPQPEYTQQGFPHPQPYGAQPGYSAQPPFAGGYSVYPQGGRRATFVATAFA